MTDNTAGEPMAYLEHLVAILKEPAFIAAVRQNGFVVPDPYPRGTAEIAGRKVLLRNEGLKVWKPQWKLVLPAPSTSGILVHYQMRHPGEVQIQVELDPYEGSLPKKPARRQELAIELEFKRELIHDIRSVFLGQPESSALFQTHKRALGSADAPQTLGAVKFSSAAGQTCSPEDDASFLAAVFGAATPLIDQVIAKSR